VESAKIKYRGTLLKPAATKNFLQVNKALLSPRFQSKSPKKASRNTQPKQAQTTTKK